MIISIIVLLVSWKVLECADRKPGTNADDTPFSDILGKILGPAVVVGVLAYFASKWWLPESVTALVRPSDIGFLLGWEL